MSKAKTSKKLLPFDAARNLTDDARVRDGARDVVAELAGVLKGAEIGDSREEYAEYLRKKYS